MSCKICNHNLSFYFKKEVLNKYTVSYFKCNYCGFIQTEKPYWLEEAYSSAITASDLGLIQRNIGYSAITNCILAVFFNRRKNFLDFAGGYGMFVRLMRDNGYDFYRKDPFCENIFAKDFDFQDAGISKFELLTAFEVMEHLEDPLQAIDEMLTYSDNILFSTAIFKGHNNEISDWWYISPETGQHIAFYTLKSLQIIAAQKGMYLYSNKRDIHLFTKKKHSKLLFKLICYKTIAKPLSYLLNFLIPSLLNEDVEKVKQKLNTRE